LLDLKGVRVVVIFPNALTTMAWNAEHPSPAELEAFWRRLFTRCGIESVLWNATVSDYVRSLQR
jgi:hypothetical protein